MRVLIADDGLGTATATALILAADGHEVRVVPIGFEGMGTGISFRPHVVLVDIKSQASHGYALARVVRAAAPANKVVAIVEKDVPYTPFGFDLILVKPFDHAILAQWMAQLQV